MREVALGRALAAQAGVSATLIECTAVAKMVEDARAGAWDIAIVAFDPGRRAVLDFAPPHNLIKQISSIKFWPACMFTQGA